MYIYIYLKKKRLLSLEELPSETRNKYKYKGLVKYYGVRRIHVPI